MSWRQLHDKKISNSNDESLKNYLKTSYPCAWCPSKLRVGSFGVLGLFVCTVLVRVVFIETAVLASLTISALDSQGLFSVIVHKVFMISFQVLQIELFRWFCFKSKWSPKNRDKHTQNTVLVYLYRLEVLHCLHNGTPSPELTILVHKLNL